MSLAVFRKSVFVLGLLIGALTTPLAAQMFTDGHKFLEAVRDLEGDTVTNMLSDPGNTLVNTRDLATGDTALHIVTEKQNVQWIGFLIQRGGNPNIANKKGVVPLMIAVTYGNVEASEALLKGGARIEEKNSLGETPLIIATHRRDVPMVRLLLEKGADPDRNDNSGRSARDYALAINSSRLTAEFTTADENRKGSIGPAYGPGL